jgi:nucleoside-diphosphate-sugar epimerase
VTNTVLIVGGRRFVGRRLLFYLLANGCRVDVLNRGLTWPANDLPPGARHRAADRADSASVWQAIGGRSYDAVFDTSGYRANEVRTVLGALDAGQYVYISTCVVYAALAAVAPEPAVPEVGLLDEDDPTVDPLDDDSGDLVAGYPGHKRSCELALLAQSRIPVVVLRPCGIYGKGDYWHRHDYFFDRVIRPRPVLIPDGHYARKVNLTSVDGLLEVCILAASQPSTEHLVLNVADADAVNYAELAGLCARVAGAPVTILSYPVELGRHLAAGAAERARFPFGPEPGFSLSGARALRTLDWAGPVLAERTAALFADFARRHRNGLAGEPDFSLDDALLAALGVAGGNG